MPNKYLQIRRRLSLRRNEPIGGTLRPEKSDHRKDFVQHIRRKLESGLRFSVPKSVDNEYFLKGGFEPLKPTVCSTGLIVGESDLHAQSHGSIEFGFTRKFVSKNQERPVVYRNRLKQAGFTRSVINLLRAARGSSSKTVRNDVDQIVAVMKSYDMPSATKTDVQPSLPNVNPRKVPDPDDHLRIRFGGLRKKLEDREWRIVLKGPPTKTFQHLEFAAGQLALLVLPDHQTLSLALNEPKIVRKLYPEGRPAVCVTSCDMLPSIRD